MAVVELSMHTWVLEALISASSVRVAQEGSLMLFFSLVAPCLVALSAGAGLPFNFLSWSLRCMGFPIGAELACAFFLRQASPVGDGGKGG